MADEKPGLPPAVTAADMVAPAPPHHGPMARLRNFFLTGLILVGPIYITINLTLSLIHI